MQMRGFFLGVVLLWGSWATPVRATEAEARPERPVRAIGLQLGLGSHFAGFGGSVTFRLDRRFAAVAGLGGIAGNVGFGGGLRFYPVGPLYTQLGFSPMAFSTDQLYYGPDLTLGVDLVRTRVSFTVGGGLGLLAWRKVEPSLDLGLGVNLGRSPDDRFAPTVPRTSSPEEQEEEP